MIESAKIILNADTASVDDLRSGLEAGAEAVMGTYRPQLLAARRPAGLRERHLQGQG